MNIMVTGGLGFIGSNFINQRLEAGDRIHNIDKVTYAANPDNIVQDVWNVFDGHAEPQYRHHEIDINDQEQVSRIYQAAHIEAVVHFAAESHVDRSIDNPDEFIHTNINGTHQMLEMFKKCHRPGHKFVHVSTDEVYGDLTESEPAFTELSQIKPNSPYAASKAASDLLVRSYYETYKLPVCITRCSNNYGPNQYPEKLIPLMILSALGGESLPVYGTGENIRDWIHVSDHCKAITCVLENFKPGEVWNIGGETEIRNIDIVKQILSALDLSTDRIQYVEDRKGHDWRYAMNINKIRNQLGWKPTIKFESGLKWLISGYKSRY